MFSESLIVSLYANHVCVSFSHVYAYVLSNGNEVVTHQQKSHLPLNDDVLYKAHILSRNGLAMFFFNLLSSMLSQAAN